ncbi:MAG: transposase [Bdellovibrio sp.]|nr:transposase [Bdellovibrio sp.]
MKKPKQLSLFQNSRDLKTQTKFFGGALLKNRRKSIRPLSRKDSIHFVLRSEWAMGRDSFLAKKNYADIDYIITRFAKQFGVRIYQRAINSNHIHLLLRITNRVLYRAFIKAVSGKIASHVMGQQSFRLFLKARGNSFAGDGSHSAKVKRESLSKRKTSPEILNKNRGFWEFRPFSRVVNWGKDFKTCVSYLKQNILEAFGFVNYTSRKNFYSRWIIETIPILSNGQNIKQ